MNLTYPSREEARRYRREIQDAVQTVRNGETPDEAALAWPAGLDRRLLLGLPIQRRTRNCLLRAEVAAGDEPLTVDDLLGIRHLTEPLLPDLLRNIDEFLDDYIETFEVIPKPADVAARRLSHQVQRMTPTEITVVEGRVLRSPPVTVRTVAMQLRISTTRVCTETSSAKEKARIALGAELECIVAALTKDLGPDPKGLEVGARIEQLLDDVGANDGGDESRRTRGLFRRTLLEEMGLEPKDGRRRARSQGDAPPPEQKNEGESSAGVE